MLALVKPHNCSGVPGGKEFHLITVKWKVIVAKITDKKNSMSPYCLCKCREDAAVQFEAVRQFPLRPPSQETRPYSRELTLMQLLDGSFYKIWTAASSSTHLDDTTQ